jgi:hypothetical protein
MTASTNADDDISAHRVRSNVWPVTHLHPPAALIAAVDDVYQALEDKD